MFGVKHVGVHELQPGVGVLGGSRAPESERSVGASGARDRAQPGGECADAVLQTGQKCDVDESPAQPPDEPGELDRAGLQQGVPSTDVGRRAEIAVSVAPTRLAGEIATNAGGSVESALHGVLSHSRQVVAADEVTDDEDLRMPGHGQVGFHRDASGMVGLGLEHLCDVPREGHGFNACRPEDGPCRKILGRAAGLGCDGHAVVSHVGDVHPHVQFDSQMFQDLGGFAGEGWREAAKNAASPVEEQYSRVFGFDAVELFGQGSGRHFADLSGQFHTGGSATGYREGEPRVALRSRWQRFGHLECTEQPAADAQRVVEGLHPWRPLREFLMAQVTLTHSDGDYQHVVLKRECGFVGAARRDHARVRVEVDRFAEQGAHVVVARELLAQ